MKRTENILIEDSDYELLQEVLPDSPCDSCDLGLACCGCPEERNYSEKVKPYKDSGVYEAALAVKRINTAGSKMEDLQNEIKEECGYLREQGFDLNRLFNSEEKVSHPVKKLNAF
jgi:hypothetical protein